ncbi:hypothetical protein SLEP1_g21618 [Rubroshorea leprosula]|uniref:EF-hand domain-containing protein n=1 Tax=Rubroshorea leprosula TaxID=152421 RepID=A0AAV5JDY8_9ROSI|nr:hypothetical protein SLEP1_g21618 [Rubroshorea leprosula]
MTIVTGKAAPVQRLSKEHIRKLILQCDNGDAVLTNQEIKKAFEKLQAFWPGYRARKGVAAADHNRDGLVSMDELDDLINYVYELGYSGK